MTKLVKTLLVCVAGLIGAGCDSESSSTSQDAGKSGTGGSVTATGSGGSGGSSGGGAGGSGGASGSGGAGASTGGSSGGGTDAGSGGAMAVSDAGGAGGSGGGGGSAADASDSGGAPIDTWETYAKGFVETFCVSCHNDDNAGDAARDYHMMSVVVGEKVDIACGTAKSAADRAALNCPGGAPVARQFPPGAGAKPTDAERDRFLRWIAAGTP